MFEYATSLVVDEKLPKRWSNAPRSRGLSRIFGIDGSWFVKGKLPGDIQALSSEKLPKRVKRSLS